MTLSIPGFNVYNSNYYITIIIIIYAFSTVLPSVRDLGTQQVPESNDITVDLNVPDSPDPFPPMIYSQWMFGDQTLSSDTSITLNHYNITFINVERNMSGNYELTVFNEAGSSTGTFELDVQCK